MNDRRPPRLFQRRQLLVAGAATCTCVCLGTSCGAPQEPSTGVDAGSSVDAGRREDAGGREDAGWARDAGRSEDAGSDAGALDAGARCGGIPVGAAASFALGSAAFVSEVFMVRDARGLYAVSALCTHQGCAMYEVGGIFECPCHDSRFTFEGDRISGPARFPLDHFSVCLDAQGNAFVDRAVTVDPSTRA